MDYQQKLAEKLVILNERGNGVLIRMNYIKKVRASRKRRSATRKSRPTYGPIISLSNIVRSLHLLLLFDH